MLEDNIRDFIMSRIEKIPKDNEFWSEYSRAIDRESEASQKIIKLLTDKNQELFFDYEECCNEVAFYEIERAYRNGFKDSFRLFLKLYKED